MTKKDDDHNAALLRADPSAAVKTETLPNMRKLDKPIICINCGHRIEYVHER